MSAFHVGSVSPRRAPISPGRKMARLLPLLTLLLFALTPLPTKAQRSQENRGVLAGSVLDSGGRPIEGAQVRIPGLGLLTLTEADGSFRLDEVPARLLRVSFVRIGYGTHLEEVHVQGGTVTRLDVTLSTAPVALRELVVTGTPGVRDPLTTPQDVDAVVGEEMERFRGESLGALLSRTISGVANIETGPQAGTPVLRGLSGTRVRVLQNGVGQEYYQYGVRHHLTTSLVEAQRVEVVRGVSSLLYGSDALGGAVNILTKELPVSPEGRYLFGGKVDGQFFTNNREWAGHLDLHAATLRFGFRGGIQLRKGHDITVPEAPDFFETSAAGTAKTGKYGDPKYTGTLPHTDFQQRSEYAQAGFRGRMGRGEIFVTHWDNENNFLLPLGGPKGSILNPPKGLGLHLAQTNLTLKGILVFDRFTLRPTFNYQKAVRQAAAPGNLIEDDPDFEVDLEKNVFTGRIELAHSPIRGLEGVLGAEVALQDGESLGPVEMEPGSVVTNVGVFAFEERGQGRLTLSAGARVDYRYLNAEANSLTQDPELLAQEYLVASGSLGLAYALREGITLAAQAGTGFRAPTVFELFADGEHGGVAAYQRGDPNLDPERALNLDLSLRWAVDRFVGEITGFWNRIADYIYLENTGTETESGLPIYQVAQTDANLNGVDGMAEATLLPWLSTGLRFSWVKGEGKDLEDPSGDSRDGPLPLLPATRLGAFVEFRAPDVGNLRASNLRLKVDGAFDKDAAGVIEPFSQFDLIPFGTASTQGYALLGLEARTTLDLGLSPVLVSITVDNLLDEVYRSFLDTYKGYALSPGRSIGLRVSAPLGLTR
ncbi:MAG: TonB-dependent receptor [Gemmatimonadetes bacterium]|nr:TonB-dependent receptor [Gemmatimonadota bacterium]